MPSPCHPLTDPGRAAVHVLLAFAMLVLGMTLLPAPPATAVAYGEAVAAPWPASFNDYTYASGATIGDVNEDMNPPYLDLASGPCPGCAGPASSVALQSDGVNAFFRIRLGTDLTDASKGGLFGGAFLTQIAVNGAVKAVVGVNGKTSTADVVYVSDSIGGTVTDVYDYPWTGAAAAVRVTSTGDGTGQFFLDYQVPLSVITTVSGGAITASTPIQLYYGSSAAANLATINKDFMLGNVSTVDFSNLATVRFVPLTYPVTFDSGGGSAVAPQVVQENTKATLPSPAPTRAGYTFDGWYTAATGGSAWDFNTVITGATTLHAHWSRTTYAVDFDTHGGSTVPTQTVNESEPATRPADPTKAGHTFTDWYTTATGNSTYDFTSPVNAPTTIHARWSVDDYLVSFDSDGGTTVADQTVPYGSPATEPTDPTRDGHTFDGWYDAPTGGAAWNFNDPVTGATPLYARWTVIPTTHTVTFDSDGGTAVPSESVVEDSPATEPDEPTRTGYTFGGWIDTSTGAAWDFAAPVTGPLDLAAVWTLDTYTVDFDANGGSSVADQSVDHGDPATEPSDPTRTGYTFDGWYDAPTAGTAWDFTTPITGPTGIHAQWTQNTYTVDFEADGGTSVTDQTVLHGDPASLPTEPTRTGFTFAGWYTAPDGLGQAWDFTDPITGNTVLHASWTQTTYLVDFDANGGTAVGDQSVPHGDPASEPVAPTRPGYTFTGWYDAPDGGTAWDFTRPITSSTGLFAQWELNPPSVYTVSFDPAGGTPVAPQAVTFGDPATEPADPTRAGFTFDGWYGAPAGGTAWDFSTPVTGNTALYAQWSVVPASVYTVTFEAAGGTPVADQSVTDGDPATEPADPTRDGYTFDGWYDAPTDGTAWDFTTPITGPTALYAQWAAIPAATYQVDFDPTGGSTVASQTVTDGAPATEPADPTRTGHTFTGWFTSETGGSAWDFSTPVTAATTLYAHWAQNTYLVDFDTNGGTPVADQSVDHGEPATEPADPNRTGHTFTGWFTSETGGSAWDFTTPIISPTTLYAHWTKNAANDTGEDDGNEDDGNEDDGNEDDTASGGTNVNPSEVTHDVVSLPATGSSVPPLMVPFALLLILGGAAVLVRRKQIVS